MSMASQWSRRRLLGLFAVAGGTLVSGCDKGPAGTPKELAVAESGACVVYRDPECCCCVAWVEVAREAGYTVTIEDRADMAAIKARFGVPPSLASCHTALIAGYAIEGHVPMQHVARLLRDKPEGVEGIAVPGMPRGSPGMEMADGSADAFEVMAFDREGRVSVFSA